MNRTDKISRESRYFGLITIALLIVCIAIGCWVPMAHLSIENPGGGFWVKSAMGALFLVVLAISIATGRECLRLRRLAKESRHWDSVRAIRPRL